MCLATRPRVLLLDEPLAGMGAEETERMLTLLDHLRGEHAVLLVEHDMDAVFALADVVTVMVEGRVLETGSPGQIRASPAVRRAYLGVDGAGPDVKRMLLCALPTWMSGAHAAAFVRRLVPKMSPVPVHSRPHGKVSENTPASMIPSRNSLLSP